MRPIKLITLAGLLLVNSAFADLYKCTNKGKVTYSDTPCSASATPQVLPKVSGYKPTQFPSAPPKPKLSSARLAQIRAADQSAERKRRCEAAHAKRVDQIKSNYWRPSQDPQRARAIDRAYADLMRCQR